MKNNQNKLPETERREERLLSDRELERVGGGTDEPVPEEGNPFGNIPRVPTQPIDPYLRENG